MYFRQIYRPHYDPITYNGPKRISLLDIFTNKHGKQYIILLYRRLYTIIISNIYPSSKVQAPINQ